MIVSLNCGVCPVEVRILGFCGQGLLIIVGVFIKISQNFSRYQPNFFIKARRFSEDRSRFFERSLLSKISVGIFKIKINPWLFFWGPTKTYSLFWRAFYYFGHSFYFFADPSHFQKSRLRKDQPLPLFIKAHDTPLKPLKNTPLHIHSSLKYSVTVLKRVYIFNKVLLRSFIRSGVWGDQEKMWKSKKFT